MSKPTDETYRERILKVQLFIQEHLDEDLALERLARVAYFSPFHFHRIFRGVVGEGVYEYVRRLRLESAAHALTRTRTSVTHIALAAGYQTHEAFTRAFRQWFGVTPTQYRAGERRAEPKKEEIIMTLELLARDVRIETLPPRRVAFLRQVGPYENVGATFVRLIAWAGERRLFGPGTSVLGVYLDDPDVTPADKLRCDCCVTVGENVAGEGEVAVQTVEGGEYAILRYKGPYTTLGEAYRWLYGTWLPTSGREPRNAPPVEVYLNSPRDAAPENLLTDICLPLAAR